MDIQKVITKIQNEPEVILVSQILKELEALGVEQACVASGWIRGWLTDSPRSDIDIAYIGKVHFSEAQSHLQKLVEKYNAEHLDWDLKGIWNAQIESPQIKSTQHNYLVNYVCSIDSVYLASDGMLHDPTGYGVEDALNGVLRMNDYEEIDYKYKDRTIVYLALEGCRRIAKFNWKPTERTIELIKNASDKWLNLNKKEKEYFYKRISKKFPSSQWERVRPAYDEFGWGFIFDQAKEFNSTKV